jgi:hypothetical protein
MNAKAETVATAPLFREALKSCSLIASKVLELASASNGLAHS